MLPIALLAALLFLQPAPTPPAQPRPAPPKQDAPPAPKPPEQPDAKPAAATPAPRTDKGWTDRNETFNARAKQGAEKGDIDIIFLGDSITQGWEGAGKKVWGEKFAPRHAVNFGIGGDRTQHVLWRIQHGNLEGLAHPKTGHAPRAVVLMIGTNNTGSDAAEDIAAGVEAVVKSLRERLPETKVLLLAIFPRSEKPDALREKITKANQRIEKLADGKAVHYLDIGNRFLEPDGTISKDTMPDFLHLSEKAYAAWAAAIAPKLDEIAPRE